MDSFIQRIKIEFNYINEKCSKLYNFFNSTDFDELCGDEKTLLENQYEVMCEYRSILSSRLELYGEKVTETD